VFKRFLLLMAAASVLSACSSNPCEQGRTNDCVIHRAKLQMKLAKQQVNMVKTAKGTLIVIPSDELFETGSDEVTSIGRYTQYFLWKYIQSYPKANISVHAYTDTVLPPKNAKALTQAQAREVAGYLWAYGVPNQTQTLSYKGMGTKRPVSSNRYFTGMANNRRVEVFIKPNCCQQRGKF